MLSFQNEEKTRIMTPKRCKRGKDEVNSNNNNNKNNRNSTADPQVKKKRHQQHNTITSQLMITQLFNLPATRFVVDAMETLNSTVADRERARGKKHLTRQMK